MEFLMKALLFFLFLTYHCTSGYVAHPHEIVRRDVNLTQVDQGLGGALSIVFGPIANLAAKANIELPVISNFRSKEGTSIF
ncbi:uncharacterized protein LOC127010847 [Drosophila biarmipes]|uniref:uncharacterized protein LOC127010847 n=1 Tax=Drosophila biarmipes TaxID=125945 RepID=UPI0007E81E3D|nr:uncharacterized protein LOC127010847 [Drosophila biarmipes]